MLKTMLRESKVPQDVVINALTYIIDAEIDEIIPEYNEREGFTYGEFTRLAVRYNLTEEDIFEELERLGVLKPEKYKKIIRCPQCGSSRLLSQLACPQCGSTDVNRITLVSHVSCGYTGVLEDMASDEGFICKKCKKPLGKEGTDYLKIGSLFRCESCASRFDAPHPHYECLGCNYSFGHREADYHTLNKYEVNKDKLKDYVEEIILGKIYDELVAEGYKIERNAKIKGQSGLDHTTNIIVRKDHDFVLIDTIVDTENITSDILTVFGKHVDLGSPKHIVIVPSKTASLIAFRVGSSNIKLVVFDVVSEAIYKTKEAVKELLETIS